MRRIYLDRKNCTLSINQGRLEIRWPKQHQLVHFPLTQIEAVIATSSVTIATSIIFEMQKYGIDLICLSRSKASSGQMLTSRSHGNVKRLQKQSLLCANNNAKLMFARNIVSARIRQQCQLLKKIYRKRPDLSIPLLNGMSQLGMAAVKCNSTQSLASLRGVEGAAAARFYSAYKNAFAYSLGFNKRIKRPPTDPVNALLSLGYTLLKPIPRAYSIKRGAAYFFLFLKQKLRK